jgi:hypothetical protein
MEVNIRKLSELGETEVSDDQQRAQFAFPLPPLHIGEDTEWVSELSLDFRGEKKKKSPSD